MRCCQIYIGIILNVITVAMVMIYKWTKQQRAGEMSPLHPQLLAFSIGMKSAYCKLCESPRRSSFFQSSCIFKRWNLGNGAFEGRFYSGSALPSPSFPPSSLMQLKYTVSSIMCFWPNVWCTINRILVYFCIPFQLSKHCQLAFYKHCQLAFYGTWNIDFVTRRICYQKNSLFCYFVLSIAMNCDGEAFHVHLVKKNL